MSAHTPPVAKRRRRRVPLAHDRYPLPPDALPPLPDTGEEEDASTPDLYGLCLAVLDGSLPALGWEGPH